MTSVSSPARLRTRFLMLRATRWLPTGLVIPVLVLLLQERGLSLGQIGLVFAAQGAMVMVLELPTGGLADSLGRRPVLIAAALFDVMAMSVLAIASSPWLLALAFGLQGVYRALESGPLDAWYVDTVQAADADHDIEGGLAAGGVVLGVAIAAGSLLASGMVALDPLPQVSALTGPLVLAVLLRLVDLLLIVALMAEPNVRPRKDPAAASTTVRQVVRGAVGVIRASRMLTVLVTVEFLWGAGMIAFETFTPARLGAVLADPTAAAAVMGPANAVAWGSFGVGAALVPRLVRRLGAGHAAMVLLGVQALTVVAIGLVAVPAGIVVAYVATLAIHGAANPVHQGMLHRAVTDPGRRATVASANSLTASLGGAVGGIVLGALADATTLTIAIAVGAVLLGMAASLYRIAALELRRPRHTSQSSLGS